MPWADEHGLAARLARNSNAADRLPLILCGPILRRTEPDSVTVWIALKQPRTVTLRVYIHAPPPADTSLKEMLIGTRETIQLGAHLHVVAVTARSSQDANKLLPGTIYFYNLFFGPMAGGAVPETAVEHLNASNVFSLSGDSSLDDLRPTRLSYSIEHKLPSFSLPPENLNKLRVIHGTCRRPQGPGLDALPTVDGLIDLSWPVADERPHLLLLNGDQIYADDVADSVLFFLMDADKALLGWSETLPGIAEDDPRLRQGNRKGIVRGTARFTTQDPNGHLLRLGEYYAMYLFNWSDALWPLQFPDFKEVAPMPPTSGQDSIILANFYKKEHSIIDKYRKTLPHVRRVLANVPCYMMFDDHDVTDDWNMVRLWCERIYSNRLGRRIIQNALLTYAVFQAWGNTPTRFEAGRPGETLLAAASSWSQSKGTDSNSEREIARLVGIPGTVSSGGQVTDLFTQVGNFFQLSRSDDALRWDYSVSGPTFEILVLDTRTRKEFTEDGIATSAHLGRASLQEQIPLDDLDPEKLFMVVATSNVFTTPLWFGTKVYGDKFIWSWWYVALWLTLKLFEPLLLLIDKLPFLSRIADPQKRSLYNPDIKDAWEPQTEPFESLLSRLARRTATVGNARRTRVLMLSGDVHFSWAARMQYWAEHPFNTEGIAVQPVDAIFAQLTSSPMNKEEKDLGKAVHEFGYIPMTDKLPGPIQWVGWRERRSIGLSSEGMAQIADWENMPGWMLGRQPPMLALKDAKESQSVIHPPDWRYRIDYILGEKSNSSFSLNLLERPQPADHKNWLKVFHDAHARYKDYARKWGDGLEIVGKNNFAELRFQWGGRTGLVSSISVADTSFKVSSPDFLPTPPLLVKIGNEIIKLGAVDRGTGVCSDVARGQHNTQAAPHAAGATVDVFKTVTQTHWWRLTGETKLLPLTMYTISLDFFDPLFPKPMVR